MKYIDNKFQNIENIDKQNIEQLMNQIKEFVLSNVDEEDIKSQIINECDSILIQYTDGNTYSIMTPGKNVRNMKFGNAGAFKINMVIDSDEESLNIIPGVCLRPNYTDKQAVHEMLHAISSKQRMYFDENGITYTKTGTKIDYYDKNLNDSNLYSSISSDGLNEGLTEYYASVITNGYSGSYPIFTVLADILNKNSSTLMKAYFSRNTDDLLAFYDDLEEKQEIINREDFINLSSESISLDASLKLLQGAIKYNLANANQDELESNIEYIKQKLSYLDDNYCLDSGSWLDMFDYFKIQKQDKANFDKLRQEEIQKRDILRQQQLGQAMQTHKIVNEDIEGLTEGGMSL